MKSRKGEWGYFSSEKRRRILTTSVLFAIPIFIYVTSFLYFGTRRNLMTVVAMVGIIPAAISCVGLIMILMRRSLPEEEYRYRLEELRRLVSEMPLPCSVEIIEGAYEPERFLAFARELADEPERGARCQKCIRLRLEEAAKIAHSIGADYFATTLTLSPHKDAVFINACGEEIAESFGMPYLPTDFKKRDGYKRSIELSAEYCLYRQNFCGCPFSKRDT